MPTDMKKNVLVSDVSRAFFEAPASRKIAVTLPDEALPENEKGTGMVGILKMSIYGTRDAAANFQKEVWRLMTRLGFSQSKYNVSLYHKRAGYGGVASGDSIGAGGKGKHGGGDQVRYLY